MDIQERLKALWRQILLNWKTSLAGLFTILLTQVNDLFGWNLRVGSIIAILGTIIGIALILSRDANITSEGTAVTTARLDLGKEIDIARMATTVERVQLSPDQQQIAKEEVNAIRNS
jgi:hypothetical protein